MGERRVVVFFPKLWFYYLRIFIRRKIRGAFQKYVLGHNNPIQAHGHDRLCPLSVPITITCLNFTCNANA